MDSYKKGLPWIIAVVAAGVVVFLIRQMGQPEHDDGPGGSVSITQLPNDESEPARGGVQSPVETKGDAGSRQIIQEDTVAVLVLADVPEAEIDRMAVSRFVSRLPIGDYRIVSIDGDALRAIIRNANAEPAFDVQLLDPEPVTLIAREAQEYYSGWQSGHAGWGGAIQGQELSSATFVIDPNCVVDGSINSPRTGTVKFERIPDTSHYLIWALAPDFVQPYED